MANHHLTEGLNFFFIMKHLFALTYLCIYLGVKKPFRVNLRSFNDPFFALFLH